MCHLLQLTLVYNAGVSGISCTYLWRICCNCAVTIFFSCADYTESPHQRSLGSFHYCKRELWFIPFCLHLALLFEILFIRLIEFYAQYFYIRENTTQLPSLYAIQTLNRARNNITIYLRSKYSCSCTYNVCISQKWMFGTKYILNYAPIRTMYIHPWTWIFTMLVGFIVRFNL